MTQPLEAVNAIYSRFTTQWADAAPSTFDNEGYDPDESKPWVRVSVRHVDGGFETLGGVGNRRVRREGSIFVQVFTPANTGTATGLALAKTASDIFEGISFSGIDCTNAVTREVGPEGSWYQHVVEVEFGYEERK